jgi:hypothetical protein
MGWLVWLVSFSLFSGEGHSWVLSHEVGAGRAFGVWSSYRMGFLRLEISRSIQPFAGGAFWFVFELDGAYLKSRFHMLDIQMSEEGGSLQNLVYGVRWIGTTWTGWVRYFRDFPPASGFLPADV